MIQKLKLKEIVKTIDKHTGVEVMMVVMVPMVDTVYFSNNYLPGSG